MGLRRNPQPAARPAREDSTGWDPVNRRFEGRFARAPASTGSASASGGDSAQGVGDRPVELDRLDVRLDHLARVVDPQLREQVGDLAPLGGEDLVLRFELPELALERPESLLAGAVDELLIG